MRGSVAGLCAGGVFFRSAPETTGFAALDANPGGVSKKLLPVVRSSSGASGEGADDEARASLTMWTAAAIIVAFLCWWPLASVAAKLGTMGLPELDVASADDYAARFAALSEAARTSIQVRLAALQLGALVLAHLLAGGFLARFASESQLRQWVLVGVFTGAVAAAIAISAGGGFSVGFFLPLPLAAAASATGGWLTRRFRPA